ncbi:MAG: glycosyltransferase family 4 protein [Rhodobiaceae bacterium]|nr:glycosyltransferase family 4 protein [Rhodobiaceae bacterium]MCC0040745.1 glycosyltransferase family 4 protein [Rhodobiaceae bacterium]
MQPKVLFDLSSLARWSGPAVGIMRAQQQLARHAHANEPDVVFTVFDPFAGKPRAIRSEWVEDIIENRVSFEPALIPNPSNGQRSLLHRMPRWLSDIYLLITKFRRKRLSWAQGRLAQAKGKPLPHIERMVRRLVKPGERTRYFNPDGSLRLCPPMESLLDDSLEIAGGDVFVGAQAGWYHVDVEGLNRLKAETGLRHVVLCYDIIPILFPQWFSERDGAIFRAYYDKVFSSAERIIFNAHSTERDARAHCRSLGFELADTRVVPLGCDVPARDGEADEEALPEGLEPGRFAMFVSTIEPRKNHQILVDAWRRLAQDGIVAATGFKLVFVGRNGWHMEDFFARLAAEPEHGRSILHLEGIDDATIRALYASAAFTLYPSTYEGFGLPPVESMLAGTPVIASTGGAVNEVVGEAGIRLDPGDVDGWFREMRRMIEDEAYRAEWTIKARTYKPVTWREAGERFFAAVREPTQRG